MPNKILDALIAAHVPSEIILEVHKLILDSESVTARRAADRERKQRWREARHVTSRSVPGTSQGRHSDTPQTLEKPQENGVDALLPSNSTSILTSSSLTSTESQKAKESEVVARRRGANGTRLPDDWQPPPEGLDFARLEIGPERAYAEIAKFKDYWAARPGAGGRKVDWLATWRNWIRKTGETRGGSNGYHGQPPRPFSFADRQERAAKALDDLDNFARGGGGADPSTDDQLAGWPQGRS
jgi:hypothetical protein